jgi:hypothetical protein
MEDQMEVAEVKVLAEEADSLAPPLLPVAMEGDLQLDHLAPLQLRPKGLDNA